MPTKNYSFTYIDDAKIIDIAADTKTFLDEIDSQMKKNDNAINDIFPIGAGDIKVNSIDSARIVPEGVKTLNIADGAVTAAKLAADAISSSNIAFKQNTVDASCLKDGSIKAEKLSDTGLDALVGGITIRRFDNQDSKADNTGMNIVGNSGFRVAGFYIPAFGIVVIERFEKFTEGSWPSDNGVKLPSYIPTPDSDVNVGACTRYIYIEGGSSNNDFVGWAYMTYKTNGYLKASSQDNSNGYIAPGAFVFRVPGNASTANLQNYVDANGVL